MSTSFWIYQIGKRSSIKHSKTRNTTKNLKICMRPWIRSYQLFLDFCPRRAFLAAPRGRKIVITRRSWQLQSSYFACADLWTCWIRFWYSRSPKLTKMICFWPFSFLYFFIFFIFFNFLGRRHEALAFKLNNSSKPLTIHWHDNHRWYNTSEDC